MGARPYPCAASATPSHHDPRLCFAEHAVGLGPVTEKEKSLVGASPRPVSPLPTPPSFVRHFPSPPPMCRHLAVAADSNNPHCAPFCPLTPIQIRAAWPITPAGHSLRHLGLHVASPRTPPSPPTPPPARQLHGPGHSAASVRADSPSTRTPHIREIVPHPPSLFEHVVASIVGIWRQEQRA